MSRMTASGLGAASEDAYTSQEVGYLLIKMALAESEFVESCFRKDA